MNQQPLEREREREREREEIEIFEKRRRKWSVL
jgi:hypothetical protein